MLLRPEFLALFNHANITPSHLITLDDLPPPANLKDVLKPDNTRWILVDHNKLEGDLGSIYTSRVHGVIDHHEEEEAVPRETVPEPRIIEKSGSCTSLVVRNFKATWNAISSNSSSSQAGHAQGDPFINESAVSKGWDCQVAKLALASILVDTSNLRAEGKVRDADKEAVAYLEPKILLAAKDSKTWDRKQFYKEINSAKKNIDNFALNDILRKDYKQWTEKEKKLGVSSVVKSLEFLVEKSRNENPGKEKHEAFEDAIEKFMDDRDLSVFAIMTHSKSLDKQFQRQLLLQSRPDSADLVSQFEAETAKELGLELLSIDDVDEQQDSSRSVGSQCWRKVWLQKETSKSRKQVAPLLRKAMN